MRMLSDAGALLGRHMRHIARIPAQLISVTLMPIAFVGIFGLLFGTAMKSPGGNYHEYIMGGIFVQVMLSNLTSTAQGVVTDLSNGIIDRFRSLPISRVSVLLGRTLSDVILGGWSCVLMAGVGYLIGWRFHHGFLCALAAFALLLFLGFAMSWLGALVGLVARSGEAIAAISFIVMMPLAFLSNAFVPPDGMPTPLRVLAEWNPVSAVVTACRELFGNPVGATGSGLPSQHPIVVSIVLTSAIVLIAAPVAVRLYRTAAAR